MNPPHPQQPQQQDNENHNDKQLWKTKNRGVRITGPECRDDYEQVGWLLAKEEEIMLVVPRDGETKKKDHPWLPVGLLRAWRQSVETRRHIQVARRLAGSKYQLLLAKKTSTTPTTLAEPQRTKDVVVGFLELGVSQMNVTAADLNASNENDGTNENQTRSRGGVRVVGVVTVGMVCVDPAMQQGGIGRSLVEAAHAVALDRWNETCVVAAMESTNTAALQLFHNCGYRPWLDSTGSNQTTQRVVMVPVRSSTTPWNGSPMERPHQLFVKHLTLPSSSTSSQSSSSPSNDDSLINDEPIMTLHQNASSSSS
jgi:ribosomal protein S18 acetylase RimI-like enzyme